MRSQSWFVATLVAGALVGLLATGGNRTSGQAVNPRPIVQWEYQSISSNNAEATKTTLDAWGAKGWELVTAYQIGKDGMGGSWYIFKRPK